MEKYNVLIQQPDGRLTWVAYGSIGEYHKELPNLRGEVVREGISEEQAKRGCNQNPEKLRKMEGKFFF